jgi:geranylgeranylglycerol-phosphate geranylgeranyltransferase
MNRGGAIIRLTRVEHSVMLVVAVVAAELIAGRLPQLPALLLSLIAPILISMGAFAINDYFDVGADRANSRIDRPIVSGAISKGGALSISIFCVVVGAAAGFFVNADAFVIALVFGLLSFLYSYRLKDMLLVGNMYIALSMVIPFIYGSYVVSSAIPASIILISFVVFLSGLAREMHGAIRDYRGDARARRVRNIVYYMGAKRSSYIASLLYVEAIAISVFMFFFKPPFWHNLVYIAPILVVDAMLLYVSAGGVMRWDSARFLKSSRNISLGAMALALVAYLAAALLFVPV